MFGLLFKQKGFSKKSSYEIAERYYASALAQVRRPEFYTQYGVPDRFDARYDLLLLHLFLILHPMLGKPEYEEVSQALFDVAFKNMDQTLREVGIGDMGVPKRMRKMMKAFNGRMHAYEVAVVPHKLAGKNIEGLRESTLEEALQRNVYGGKGAPEHVQLLEAYVRDNLIGMRILDNGSIEFKD